MLKKMICALLPLAMLSATVRADDDLSIDVSSIRDASAAIVDSELDIDVDQLSAEVGTEARGEDDAVEACFRRFGYRCGGWNYGCYRSCYSYCRPLYSYRAICYAPPVYRCVAAPIYHCYWGCY